MSQDDTPKRLVQEQQLMSLLHTAARWVEEAVSLAHRMGQRETDAVYPLQQPLYDAIDKLGDLADQLKEARAPRRGGA